MSTSISIGNSISVSISISIDTVLLLLLLAGLHLSLLEKLGFSLVQRMRSKASSPVALHASQCCGALKVLILHIGCRASRE